jgi:hypothetical protein
MGDNGFSENVLAIEQRLDDCIQQALRLRAVNAELVSHLKVIVNEYDDTYDADQDADGRWTGAASIPLDTMIAVKRLLETL